MDAFIHYTPPRYSFLDISRCYAVQKVSRIKLELLKYAYLMGLYGLPSSRERMNVVFFDN